MEKKYYSVDELKELRRVAYILSVKFTDEKIESIDDRKMDATQYYYHNLQYAELLLHTFISSGLSPEDLEKAYPEIL